MGLVLSFSHTHANIHLYFNNLRSHRREQYLQNKTTKHTVLSRQHSFLQVIYLPLWAFQVVQALLQPPCMSKANKHDTGSLQLAADWDGLQDWLIFNGFSQNYLQSGPANSKSTAD